MSEVDMDKIDYLYGSLFLFKTLIDGFRWVLSYQLYSGY